MFQRLPTEALPVPIVKRERARNWLIRAVIALAVLAGGAGASDSRLAAAAPADCGPASPSAMAGSRRMKSTSTPNTPAASRSLDRSGAEEPEDPSSSRLRHICRRRRDDRIEFENEMIRPAGLRLGGG